MYYKINNHYAFKIILAVPKILTSRKAILINKGGFMQKFPYCKISIFKSFLTNNYLRVY